MPRLRSPASILRTQKEQLLSLYSGFCQTHRSAQPGRPILFFIAMDIKTLQNITYGLYVVGTSDNGRPTGCIINTCFQVTSENPIVAISMNKNNYTHDVIARHRKFSLAILAEESDTSLITAFGFQSGRDRNKYDGYDYSWENGVPILKGKFSGHIVCEVLHIADNETHDVIFARVIDTIADNGTPMTYAYYHHVIKGKAPKNAPTYVKEETVTETASTSSGKRYVCEVCGYIHEGELPDDFKCPICQAPRSCFKEI